jgi:hypothetical protein
MADAGDGPFLRESVGPVLRIGEIDEIADVLHDAKLLVVGFLHQETIVLDASASLGKCKRHQNGGKSHHGNTDFGNELHFQY